MPELEAVTFWRYLDEAISFGFVTPRGWSRRTNLLRSAEQALAIRDIVVAGVSTSRSIAGHIFPEQALEDLSNIEEDALNMEYPLPTSLAIDEARRIITAMNEYRPLDYEVFAMPDGEVGISVSGPFGRSMLLVCESNGGARCVVTVNRVSRQARYDESKFLVDDFVKEGLRDLEPNLRGGDF